MNTTSLELTCRDSVVARDGRPFGVGAGNRMRSLEWPTPSMVAGSLRTALARDARKTFEADTARELLKVAVAGFLPSVDGTLYFPTPLDCVPAEREDLPPLRAVPVPQSHFGGVTSWPSGLSLEPVMIPLEAAPDEFKPGPAPAWWPADAYAAWLMGDRLAPFDRRFLCAPEIEERTHVALDRNSGAAGDGDLFSTEALALAGLKRFRSSDGGDAEATVTPRYRVRVRAEGWCHDHASQLAGFHTTGGERRLVHYRAVTDEAGWQCPTSIATALSGARAIRMDLVTPAIFGRGWLPNWLDDSGIGAPPALDLQLKLIGAAVGRWRAISGWSLNAATDPNGRLGPKPIRRMVPAGSVYFFEVLAGDPAALASRWLESVSDDDQERRDGFGLAAWGTWNRLQSV